MELLAPAGSWEALQAAVSNGADSVYLGGQQFSARHSADNFNSEELKEALFYIHSQGKKLYLAVNTLLDKQELDTALQFIFDMYLEGIDAVIVQDLGLINILNRILPDLPVHASTQMTIHNAQGCELLYEQGLHRVVLARELTAKEIATIKNSVPDMELEVFAHGALCYSYSGQCLFSSMVGQRSGNRGRCAQPCRMPYKLVGKNNSIKLPDNTGPYLLSLSDICLIDHVAALAEAGVTAIKIEGRMKRPEYVATATRIYRQALDQLTEKRVWEGKDQREDLFKIFNRTFSTGYLYSDRKNLLNTQRPNNRGVLVGRILEQGPDRTASIKLSGTLREGDGVEVWVSRGKPPAVIVTNMLIQGQVVKEASAGQIVRLQLNGFAAAGDRVFKTHDEELIGQARASIKQGGDLRIPVDVEVAAQPGFPLGISYRDQDGYQCTVYSHSRVETAEKYPLDIDVLTGKLGRLGQTPYRLQQLRLSTSEPITIPFSELNEARRQAVACLIELRKEAYARKFPDRIQFNKSLAGLLKREYVIPARIKTRLSVAVSGSEEARTALKAGAQRVYVGLEGLTRRKAPSPQEIIDLVNYAQDLGKELIPALPRIQKTEEMDKWKGLADKPSKFLVGNIGALEWCLKNNAEALADYSLNIFNPESLAFLLDLGVQGACLSPELDIKRLQDFRLGDNIEMLVHGDIQLMISECCIFNQLFGGEMGSCRSFCQKQTMYLQDEKKYFFPVATDANCRFYIFNSRSLCLIEYLDRFLQMGVGWLRIEARRSPPEEVRNITSTYRQAIQKLEAGSKTNLSDFKDRLGLDPGSYTRGHFLRGVQ